MCKMNVYCPIKEGPCPCIVRLQIQPYLQLTPMMNDEINNPFMFCGLIRIMTQQVEELKKTAELASKVLENITNNKKNHSDQNDSQIVNSGETCSCADILFFLQFNPTPQSLQIQFIDIPPNPAYKDRCFSLSVVITDQENNKIVLQENICLKIMLFTCQKPINPLKVNTSGDQILLGNTQAEGKSDFFFKKVIIKEISSRFLNNRLFFVIAPQNAVFIKPLIIKDFIIKSRKSPQDSINKHTKMNDGANND
ncbi:hypothetical protein SteCoe_25417 [Stentor coeruleus]|uniref:Uncharacterized protein n=1 Tax=Stentor coeruleus TaxID=5963 RepID=A0A1R2BF90_9CILI|nr:hypothetical protein SteCoe_25417 [Stentor coeruleus]